MGGFYIWLYFSALILGAIGGLMFVLHRRRSPAYAKWNKRVGCLMFLVLISPVCAGVSNIVYANTVGIPNEQKQIHTDTDRIVEALTQFKQGHGHYPEQLAELVPQYLQFVPVNPAQPQGREYRYAVRNGVFFLNYEILTSGFFRDIVR